MNQKISTIDLKGIDVDGIINRITLKIFNVGTKPLNYKTLQLLPSDINSIMKEIKTNKTNTNARITQMERIGLVRRERGTGKVDRTYMADCLLELIGHIKKEVSIGLPKLLEEQKL